jgi:hypothetical protein
MSPEWYSLGEGLVAREMDNGNSRMHISSSIPFRYISLDYNLLLATPTRKSYNFPHTLLTSPSSSLPIPLPKTPLCHVTLTTNGPSATDTALKFKSDPEAFAGWEKTRFSIDNKDSGLDLKAPRLLISNDMSQSLPTRLLVHLKYCSRPMGRLCRVLAAFLRLVG